ncbi:hypothetical protein LLEC1_03472 [Akanthomyces lecanii]|uniref:protein-ribulosamine 3-kinase n=1 Tax=Cordyceps confragosa TaxID=2714763 RepID=A0A179ID90_CORDF|nr:hypothetical protein LLEC1_03472 [Akanthomyces lecanii]
MVSSIDSSTAAVKPLEAVAIIQSQVDALKEVYQGQFPVDSAVLGVLPQGTESAECQRYGQSGWSFTAKVVSLQNGAKVPYFLKYVPGELGRQQLFGEFTGMTELWKLSPEFVVKPVAWGKLADTSQDWYFLLTEFKNLSTQLVDADKLAARVAQLHKRSQAQSDTGGRFGFPIQTFDGARLQSVGWDPSWASFFAKLLAEAYRQDTEANGVWPELERAHQRVQADVIPRLLGVLEENGRRVVPTLIHGDMWEGNLVSILNDFHYLLNKYAADIEDRKREAAPAESQQGEVAYDRKTYSMGLPQAQRTETAYDSGIKDNRMSATVEARD